jgi:hypothetical protein
MLALTFAASALSPALTSAQDAEPQARGPIKSVEVRDRTGQPVPYAVVSVGASAPRVADIMGIAELPTAVTGDSVQINVRRIGYRPFGEYATQVEDGRFVIHLDPLPRALIPRTITERRDTPLARRGFYERMERVRTGANLGRFITPEELDQRHVTQVSAILAGEQYIVIQRHDRRPILSGRGAGCAVTVLLDGMKMTNMVEDIYTREGQDEVNRLGGRQTGTARFLAGRQSVDDLISALSVAGIEIYPTAAGAPVELQRAAGNSACAIVAIWSGGRQ